MGLLGTAGVVSPLAAQNLVQGAEKRAKYVYRPATVPRLTIRPEDFTNDDGPQPRGGPPPAGPPASRAAADLAALQGLQAVRRASGVYDQQGDARVALAKRQV